MPFAYENTYFQIMISLPQAWAEKVVNQFAGVLNDLAAT